MELSDYQEKIKAFAIYPGANTASFPELNYLVLGLASEAGEVAGKVKKLIRDNVLDEEKFLHEIGDCLWYITMLCNCTGVTLQQLAEMNYDKLYERKQSGTIKGEGDVRVAVPETRIIIPEHIA